MSGAVLAVTLCRRRRMGRGSASTFWVRCAPPALLQRRRYAPALLASRRGHGPLFQDVLFLFSPSVSLAMAVGSSATPALCVVTEACPMAASWVAMSSCQRTTMPTVTQSRTREAHCTRFCNRRIRKRIRSSSSSSRSNLLHHAEVGAGGRCSAHVPISGTLAMGFRAQQFVEMQVSEDAQLHSHELTISMWVRLPPNDGPETHAQSRRSWRRRRRDVTRAPSTTALRSLSVRGTRTPGSSSSPGE